MCIACELGYWAMVDALEAERDAAKKRTVTKDPTFVCEPSGEALATSPSQRTVDESAP